MNDIKLILINPRISIEGDAVPLGLIYLAGYLKKYKDLTNLKILDLNFDNIQEEIQKFNPDIIGISAMTVDYSTTIKIAKEIKEKRNIPIIVGGPHISTLSSSLNESFDIGVIGEGEETMSELLDVYNKYKKFNNQNLKKIKGIVFHFGGKCITTEIREPIIPLDKIPPLDKTLIHKQYLRKRILHNRKCGVLASLLTSRGCPFNCVFCSTRVLWGNKLRYNSPERVAEEIKDYVKNYDAKYISFWDDLFADKQRIKELIKVFKKENINLSKEDRKKVPKKERIDVPLHCSLRVNLVDDELCELIKKLGVVRVGFGFESGSDRYLRYLKKSNTTLEHIHNAIKTCKRHGLLVGGSLIFGGPGETIGDMKDTLKLIDFMIEQDIENVWSYIMTPFPKTEIWEIAKQREKVNEVNMNWDLLSYQNIDNPLLLDDTIDKEEFKKIFWEGREKQRYFKWKRIKYELIHNPFQLFKNTLRKPNLAMKLILKKRTEDFPK